MTKMVFSIGLFVNTIFIIFYFYFLDSAMNDFESMLVNNDNNNSNGDNDDGSQKSAKTNKIDQMQKKKSKTIYLNEKMREACLPKLLCEISAKPLHLLNDKEKSLLALIG